LAEQFGQIIDMSTQTLAGWEDAVFVTDCGAFCVTAEAKLMTRFL
jgi:hypothetical protein